ncbi:hypothetical protein BGW42_007117 [Actinomortierella wolfii]|nr:hypothetical protein BGW42_007117 [Actinomortierella wolfii]
MDLSEIRFHVATFLTHTDHKTCSLVCKVWYQDFSPLVWESINVRKSLALNTEDYTKWLSCVRTHARWFKYLDYPHDTLVPQELHDILLDQCRSLKSVTVTSKYSNDWNLINSLAKVNPDLHKVIQDSVTAIHIRDSTSISFSLRRIDNQDDIDSDEISNEDIVSKCTERDANLLKHLSVDDIEEDDAIYRLLSLLIHSGLSNKVKGMNLGSHLFHDNQLIALINSIPEHQLRMVKMWFNESDVIRTLVERQYQSLKLLSCYTPRSLENDVVVSILMTCNRLRHLDLDMFNSLDLRAILGGPWKCTEMEEMKLPLDLNPICTDRSLYEIAFAEKDNIQPYRREHEQAELVFTHRLAGLPKLRRVDFGRLTLNSNPVMICYWPQCVRDLEGLRKVYRDIKTG